MASDLQYKCFIYNDLQNYVLEVSQSSFGVIAQKLVVPTQQGWWIINHRD